MFERQPAVSDVDSLSRVLRAAFCIGHHKADSDGFEVVTFMVLSKAAMRVEHAA